MLPSRPARRSRSSDRSRTTRWRCSAATRSPRTSGSSTLTTSWGSRSTRCSVLSPDGGRSRTPGLRGHRRRHVTARRGRRRRHCRRRVRRRRRRPGRSVRSRHLRRGCDATDLHLPGVQEDLVEAILATGTPVVLVLITGRPYALGAFADRAAAVVQSFFPGQRGGQAIAEVLTGRPTLRSSARQHPRRPRRPARHVPVRSARAPVRRLVGGPHPAYAFGHGLSYTSFRWEDAAVTDPDWAVDGFAEVAVTVRNVGERDGSEVVQLYLHDPVAQVTRPVVRLVGYARVELAAGEATRVIFTVPPTSRRSPGPRDAGSSSRGRRAQARTLERRRRGGPAAAPRRRRAGGRPHQAPGHRRPPRGGRPGHHHGARGGEGGMSLERTAVGLGEVGPVQETGAAPAEVAPGAAAPPQDRPTGAADGRADAAPEPSRGALR
ncbi:glycoside hydrolase family 3 C-terminal domain-containing protein [Oerskovia sp. M15]